MKNAKIKVVTIGGGTGSFTFLTELKELPNIQITAVVAMSDSGGSTGRLRVDMGVLPAGDVRQALVALSRSPAMLRELFTYRYERGSVKGHTFGNLFLSTLEKVTDSLEDAIVQAGKLLNVKGRIYPVTLTKHDLVVKVDDVDGSSQTIVGEGVIDTSVVTGYSRMYLTDGPLLNPHVAQAIADADIVIIAPGNFYCSIVPNFLVVGLTQALQESKALKVMVANLLTKEGHTDRFNVVKFLTELEHLSGGFVPSTVIYNTGTHVTQELKQIYKSEGGELVELGDAETFKQEQGVQFVGGDIIAKALPKTASSADTVKRSLLRHDAQKVLGLIGIHPS